MTIDGCHQWRQKLGMMAGDLLGSDERPAVQAHLDGCSRCTAELAEIGAIARLLPRADPDRVVGPLEPTARFTRRVFSAVAAERRARNRRRVTQGTLVAVAAAALAVVIPVTFGRVVPDTLDRDRAVQFAQAPTGVTAAATWRDRAWGTQIQLTVAGLDDGVTHAVWFEQADGSRVPAGTFTGDGARSLSVTLAAAVDAADAVAIGISDDQGGTVLRAPVPGISE